jgi:hypothetical protein
MVGRVSQRGLDDVRVPAAPVVAVAGPQPHGLALPLNDQPVAIVLDLVQPIGAGWNLGASRGDAGVERRFSHPG